MKRLLVSCVVALSLSHAYPAQAGFLTNAAYLSAEKAHDNRDYATARRKWEELLRSRDKDIRTIAAFRLHDYYDEGKGVAKDSGRALYYLKLAADAGGEMSSSAHWRLGHYYEWGHDGAYPVDRRLALRHYTIAARLGNETAEKSLSELDKYPDAYLALHPEHFSTAADDIAPGGLKLAYEKLKNGDGVTARRIFEWHARRGDAQAQYAMAVLLEKSKNGDEKKRAQAWGLLSAKGGWPEAQRIIGVWFYRHSSVVEAKSWLRRAVDQGDHEAVNILGAIAANPLDESPPDYAAAKAYFERAISMGNTKALTNLGDLYAEGSGIEVDKQKAIQLYTLAADAGELEGRSKLYTLFNIVHKSGVASKAPTVAVPTLGTSTREVSPVDLFTSVSPSVLQILAVSANGKSGSQGSAVAISADRLVTNCHVLKGAVAIGAEIGGEMAIFKRDRVREDADICLLRSTRRLASVTRVRGYGSLKVGERVYAVGSPSGLENTFSEGIISGLRRDRGIHYIQTSAAISPGSSGGGLFDQEGRLIGITTFGLKDAEGLNFAVSADEIPR